MPPSPGRRLLAALPVGWQAIGRCRFGIAGPVGEANGCYALAHPDIGIALLDLVPEATPNAEARLRRALSAADFWPRFSGNLPVWHGRIEPGQCAALPGLLAEGFRTLPSLTLPGRDSWIAAVRAALAEDRAWEVPDRPSRPLPPPVIDPVEDEEEEEGADPAPARSRGRRLLVGLGVALACGVVGWIALRPDPPLPAPVVQAALPAPPMPVAPSPGLPPIERVTLPELPLASAAPVLAMPVEPPPVQPAPAQPAPPFAAPAQVEAAPPPVVRALPAAPVAPVAAARTAPGRKPPAVRRASARPVQPAIDPRCARALYRYQRGTSLSAAEAAHVRDGCATRR